MKVARTAREVEVRRVIPPIDYNNSTISSNSARRGSGGGIFNIGTVNIDNSTISSNFANFHGGGINNSGRVRIDDSSISNNSASSNGGGINNSGETNIYKSTISVNSADNLGGGINNSGSAYINRTTISSNSAENIGGILNSSNGRSSISNSTISGNFAYFNGGIASGGTTNIEQSTISGNSANVDAGIFIYNFSGRTNIRYSTITGNSSFSGASGITNSVGGTAFVDSSIVSGNANIDLEITPSGGIFISGNHNFIGIGNSIALNSFNRDRDQIGITDPLLEELADNGGSTLTHLPLPNSPVIDAGNTSNFSEQGTDQRGEQRLTGEALDIGAVELRIIELIIGTMSRDTLNGTTGEDRILGLGGNDVINGLDDNDVLFGHQDRDTLNGDAGNDTIFGGKDNDLIFGSIGEDGLMGEQGSDSIFGQESGDTIFGGKDDDFIDGGLGNDFISGDLGRDTLIGGEGRDTMFGGDDIDIFELTIGEGLDRVRSFVPGTDIILLDKTTFTAITSDSGTGFSVNTEFAIVTSDADAESSAAFIVYNSNNGKLFYNANGTAAEFGSGGEFANLTNTPSISENDFFLRR